MKSASQKPGGSAAHQTKLADSKQVEQMRSHWKSALERTAAGML